MAVTIKDFEEYLKKKNVSSDRLDCKCDDEILLTVSRSMGNWRTLAMYFKSDVKAIEHGNSEEEARRYDMLKRWKVSSGLKATYRELVSLFLKADHASLAQKVCDELAKVGEGSTQENVTPEAVQTTTVPSTSSAQPVPNIMADSPNGGEQDDEGDVPDIN